MDENRKTVALLCLKYEGGLPPLEGPFLALDSTKYRKLCIYLKKASDLPNPVEDKGCRSYYMSGLRSFRIFNLGVVWKLVKVLRAERVDILHCQRHQATVYGAIAAKLAKTRVVLAHVHGLNRSRKLRRRLINVLVLRWVNKIISVSEASREDVVKSNRHVKPEQVVCLNNSIDCGRFVDVGLSREDARKRLGLNAGSFVFGTVGRLAPTKGLTYLINAFATVKKHVPNSHLIIVGDGRMRDELEQLVGAADCKDVIHFLGYRTDVEKVLKAMDIFVMASIAEGMPGALLEALAAGIPCVATQVGGIPGVLEEGRLGVLVPAGDADALAAAMSKVVRGMKDFAEMAVKGKKDALLKYDHLVAMKRLDQIYETEYELASARKEAL